PGRRTGAALEGRAPAWVGGLVTGTAAAEGRAGPLNGFAAYGMWGLVPLLWPLLIPAGAVEILAHRMVWSLFFVAAALLFIRRWAWLGALLRPPRARGLVRQAATATRT